MADPLNTRAPRAVAAAALAIYLVCSLAYLDRFPIVGQDEPWIAEPGYTLATKGTLASDLFAGYHGMERHQLTHMPIYALFEGAIFRVAGAGVVQMRALSVAFGLWLLLAVYVLGREIGGEPMAAVAVVLMVAQSLAMPTEVRPIGILLLDAARINRYDIGVPALGLTAFWVVLRAAPRSRRPLFVLAGILAGLSGLCHLYGAFWLPALAALLAVRDGLRRSLPHIAALIIGFALTWSPWVAWIAINWSDYVAQMRPNAARFDLLSPAFYAGNIISADGPISIDWLATTIPRLSLDRVGAWTLTLGVPATIIVLLRRLPDRASGEAALLIVGAVQFVLFVALLRIKTFNYVIALWPLGALALAWLAIEIWQRSPRGVRVVRAALVLLGAAILVEGGGKLVMAEARARNTSSYDAFERQIAACIPAGSRVIGFPDYWLGLRHFSYRSWLVPMHLANPDYETDPVPLDVSLDRIDPGVILIDRRARALFEATANPANRYHHLAVGWDAFRARRPLTGRCVVRDPSYGTIEVYEVPPRRGPGVVISR